MTAQPPDPCRTDSALGVFVELLLEWQRKHNLVGASTLDAMWARHIEDSLQLLDVAPPFRNWVDLGSGAGFPGMVVAIARKDFAGEHFTLVESNMKKAAFLRAAARLTGAHVTVAAERIETHAPRMAGIADIVSARALALLPELFRLAHPYMHAGTVLLLPKGRSFAAERNAAAHDWDCEVTTTGSRTDPEGVIVSVRRLKPRSN